MSYSQINEDLFRLINDLGKQYSWLNPVSVFTAEYMIYALGLSLVLFWFSRTRKNRQMVIYAVMAFLIAEIFGKLAGLLYYNNQPFAELSGVNQLIERSVNNSFPSDHTILFFSICFTYWFMHHNKAKWLWPVLAVCVGISRILVGVHYPGDVAVGALLGVGSAWLVNGLAYKLTFIQSLLALYEKGEQYLFPVRLKPGSKSQTMEIDKD